MMEDDEIPGLRERECLERIATALESIAKTLPRLIPYERLLLDEITRLRQHKSDASLAKLIAQVQADGKQA